MYGLLVSNVSYSTRHRGEKRWVNYSIQDYLGVDSFSLLEVGSLKNLEGGTILIFKREYAFEEDRRLHGDNLLPVAVLAEDEISARKIISSYDENKLLYNYTLIEKIHLQKVS